MRVLKNKTWISCTLLFVAHQISQKLLNWDLGFINHYLDPFLCIPILLGLILQERIFLIDKYFNSYRPMDYRFSLLEIVVATTCFAILFEEGFPKWSIHFTKDYWDYLAYVSGGAIFYFFINEERIP